MVALEMTLQAEFSVTRGDLELEVSLEADAGETVALLGPNGAGKSTIVSAITGLIPIERGTIALADEVFDDADKWVFVAPERRGIGTVFQDYLLFEHMSVAQNVGFGLSKSSVGKEDRSRLVSETLLRYGLNDLANRKARDLSGGQKQRVALARALITEPRLLLLDEPTSSLDATARIEVRRQLADTLGGFSGPRLLVTHDPTEAFLLADKIYILENGRITQFGSAEEIRLMPRTPYVADLVGSNLFVGVASDGDVEVNGHTLHVGDRSIAGDVVATVHPRAIAVYRNRPDGSPRNTWETTITRIEHYGDRVRLLSGDPLPLTIEVTPSAVDALGLDDYTQLWVAIKATEINVQRV